MTTLNQRVHRGSATRGHVNRNGNIAILSVFLLVVVVGIAALAVETGVMATAKSELQRCADAAATAAIAEYISSLNDGYTESGARNRARSVAIAMVAKNTVGNTAPVITENFDNDENGNIVFGRVNFDEGSSSFTPTSSNTNAIRITVRRSATENGEIPLLFSAILGSPSKEFTGTAMAVVATEVQGFKDPGSGTLNILPFVVHEDDWNDLMNGNGEDNFSWDEDSETVDSGGDGILELSMFPQSTNSSGNFGSVDIGNPNNSTADAKRQIEFGVNSSDLSYHGGKIELDDYGELQLNGDTGVSAGIKSALEAVKGRPSVIMVYKSVSGNGNNAMFTIVKFVGVRVMEVDLTGSNNASGGGNNGKGNKGNGGGNSGSTSSGKRIVVQPANVQMSNTIPGSNSSSENITTGVVLFQ